MRKLLSLLTISGIVGSASTSVVSCGKATLADVAKVNFYSSSIYFTRTEKQNDPYGSDLYDTARKLIANLAVVSVSADDVKKDSTLSLKITLNDKTINDDKTPIKTGAYTVTIDVKSGDKWFQSTDKSIVRTLFLAIKLDPTKDTPSKDNLIMQDLEAGKQGISGGSLYGAIRVQLANYTTAPNTSADQIKGNPHAVPPTNNPNPTGIRIALFDDKGEYIQDDFTLGSKMYKVGQSIGLKFWVEPPDKSVSQYFKVIDKKDALAINFKIVAIPK